MLLEKGSNLFMAFLLTEQVRISFTFLSNHSSHFSQKGSNSQTNQKKNDYKREGDFASGEQAYPAHTALLPTFRHQKNWASATRRGIYSVSFSFLLKLFLTFAPPPINKQT